MNHTYTPRFGREIFTKPQLRWYAVTFYQDNELNFNPAARTQMVRAHSMIHAANMTHKYNRDIISITLQPDLMQPGVAV